jgi:RING-type zinc-finger
MISDYLKQNLGIDIEEPDVEVTFDSVIKFLQLAVIKIQDVYSSAADENHFLLQNKLRLVKNLSKEDDEEAKLSLYCSICESRYDQTERRPLVLLCGHTFCKECHTKSYS